MTAPGAGKNLPFTTTGTPRAPALGVTHAPHTGKASMTTTTHRATLCWITDPANVEHAVDFDEVGDVILAGLGNYPTRCGTRIHPAALTATPILRCPTCQTATHPPSRASSAMPAEPRPMLFVRLRQGHIGETRRVVHLVPVPDHRPDQLEAACGERFASGTIEHLAAFTGMPCLACLTAIQHTTTHQLPDKR